MTCSRGKYVESDPIGLYGGSYSTYSYTNDNPISLSDPRGLQTLPLPVPFLGYVPPAPPGSPLNNAIYNFLQMEAQGAQNLFDWTKYVATQAVASCSKRKDDDHCYQRWEAEDRACNNWSFLGDRAVRACKTRAADRRNLCTANGGKPNPGEPPQWTPSRDYMN